MIPNQTFATTDQVLEYYNFYRPTITNKPNLTNIEEFQSHNYYVVEEDGKQPCIILVNTVTEFYVSIRKILMKKTGQNVFSKIPNQNTTNMQNGIFNNKILGGTLRIKHIESDSRIKMEIRNRILPTQIINLEQGQRGDIGLPGVTGSVEGSGQVGNTLEWFSQRNNAVTATSIASRTIQQSVGRIIRIPQQPAFDARFDGPLARDQDHYEGAIEFPRARDQDYYEGAVVFSRARDLIDQSNITNSIQPTVPEEIKDNSDYRENVTCKICLVNKINIVCIPCGHCFCSECNTRTRNNLCALCRKPITKSQALFI